MINIVKIKLSYMRLYFIVPDNSTLYCVRIHIKLNCIIDPIVCVGGGGDCDL